MSVAILGAVISVVAAAAAVVSAVWARQSGRVQSSSAEDDLQDKFNQLISTLTKLQGEAAELGVQGMAPAGSAALAKQLGLGNQLEVVGAQSHAMLHPADKSEPTPDLDWSAAYILAATFDQTWHADWAEDYWKRSVEKAEDDAKLIALVGAARHYFMRNDEGDLGRGRECHAEAIRVIDRIGRVNDMCFQQKCSVYFEGVMAEYGAGNWNEMITALWNCFKAAERIHTPMKAMWCTAPLFGFIDQWNLLPGMNAAPDATALEKSALDDPTATVAHAAGPPGPGRLRSGRRGPALVPAGAAARGPAGPPDSAVGPARAVAPGPSGVAGNGPAERNGWPGRRGRLALGGPEHASGLGGAGGRGLQPRRAVPDLARGHRGRPRYRPGRRGRRGPGHGPRDREARPCRQLRGEENHQRWFSGSRTPYSRRP